MIRAAMTCNTPDCMAVFLELDDMPEGMEFEDDAARRGWVSRPAVLALPGRPETDVTGHLCPACAAGRGPVMELGDCRTCMGRVTDTTTGVVCEYCRSAFTATEEN